MTDHRPSLVDVFEHYGRRVLTSRGQYQKAECPLLSHEDRNPSASLNEDTGKWQCWSCDGHGDAYDIIIANEESCAGFADAKRFAEEHFGSRDSGGRGESVSGAGVSLGPRNRKRSGGAWVPAWRRGL